MSNQVSHHDGVTVLTNFCHGATSLVDAANRIHGGDEPSFETFEHFTGIEHTIAAAVEPACREAFGRRFIENHQHGGFGVSVVPHQKGVALKSSWHTVYRGYLFDFLDNVDTFLRVFDTIRDAVDRDVRARYPEVADVQLTHRHHYDHQLSLQLTVVISPRMSFAIAA